MKSVHLPNFEPLPQPPEAMPQPVLGESAVLHNDAALHALIQSDRALEMQSIIQKLQAGVPDPRSTSFGEPLMRATFREPFSSRAEYAELASWLNDAAPNGYEDAMRSHGEAWVRHRRDAQVNDIEGLAQVMETRGRLAHEYGPRYSAVINAYLEKEAPPIFHDWKIRAEENVGQKLAWTEWLTREPDTAMPPQDAAGATDQQLLNVLQWNADHVRSVNADPEVQKEIETYRVRTEQALTVAVADERLSPVLLEGFQRTKGKVPIFIGDVFDLGLVSTHAYYETIKNHIILGKLGNFKTIVHEQLHGSGGFANVFLDEGMTDKYTKRIVDTDAELRGEVALYEDAYSYVWNAGALNDVLSLARITDVESSQIYAGKDRVENEARLQALVKERVGADFLGYALDFYASKKENLYESAVQEAMETANNDPDIAALDLARLTRLADISAARLTNHETLGVWNEMVATQAPAKAIIERKIEALREQQEALSAAG